MASTSVAEAGGQNNKNSSPPPHVSFRTRLLQAMGDHPHIACVALAALLTVASNYARGLQKPEVRQQPPPRRFFPVTSPVLDYPYGNLGDVGSLLVEEEVLFVMYYAPWCVQSKRARKHFEQAATYLKQEVRFVAVNCWYTNGTCRKQNNFLRYPAIFFYHMTLDSYKYQGVLTGEYMIEFVERLLRPLTPLYTKEELTMFVAERDNVALGFFDFNMSPQPPGFLQFYYAALRTYSLDSKNPVDFALITDASLAQQYSLKQSGSIHLIRSLNHTLGYPNLTNITCGHLTTWLLTYRQPLIATWILPSGAKSLSLSAAVGDSPALLVFAPNHPVNSHPNQYHSVLHEIGLEYYNCQNDSRLSVMVSALKLSRWLHAAHHSDLAELCDKTDNGQKEPPEHLRYKRRLPAKRCCQSVSVSGVRTQYNSCDVCLNYAHTDPASWLPCDMSSIVDSWLWPRIQLSVPQHRGDCAEVIKFYNPGQFVTICCENHSYYNIPGRLQYDPGDGRHRRSNDPYIISTSRNLDKKRCSRLSEQRRYGWVPEVMAPGSYLEASSARLLGYGCRTNRTLAMVLIDKALGQPFLSKLGLDRTSLDRKQAVAVIFDKQAEAQYVLDRPVTKSNLVEFIENYTASELPVYRRSYPASNTCGQGADGDVCILEATSQTFWQFIADGDKDVVMLYYAPWCGFCAGFAHIYLSLAKYFRNTRSIVFARVNAYTNDLPWEYTVDVYPTIMLFPAHRQAESVTFPDHLKKSLPNLIFFVLHYGSTSLKIETSLSICTSTCLHSNIDSAVQRIQSLNRDILRLQRQLRTVQTQLEARAAEPSATNTILYKDGSSLLQWYEHELRERILAGRLMQDQARFLHRELVANQGPLMERHRLLRLLNKYKGYQRQYMSLVSGRGFEQIVANGSDLDVSESLVLPSVRARQEL